MYKYEFDIITKATYLKDHMILFNSDSLSLLLYDNKGSLLDEKYIGFLINDIFIIDDNYIMIKKLSNILIRIKIVNNTINFIDKLFTYSLKIYDLIYIKKSKLLVINFGSFIGIWDIDSFHKNPIQIINNWSFYLLNFNSNLFISYGYKNISIYQKTNNLKLYQLSTILNFDIFYKLSLMKLDNRTLMIVQKNEIYLIDMRNMMTKNKFKFINGKGKIVPLYNNDKNIYLNIKNYIYIIRYNKYNLEITNIIEKSKLIEIDKNKEKEIKLELFTLKLLRNFHLLKSSFTTQLIREIFGNYNEVTEISFFTDNYMNSIKLFHIEYGKSKGEAYEMKFKKKTKEKRIGFKNSINYSIINGKNYDKRNKLKKIKEIKNERIRNNPNKLKKKLR